MCQSACCGVIDEDISKAFRSLRSEPAVMPHMITPTPVGKSPNKANLEAYMGLFKKGYPSFVSYLQGLWVLDFLGLLKKAISFICLVLWYRDFGGGISSTGFLEKAKFGVVLPRSI